MPSILVVDDEKSVQESLSFLLRDNGHAIDIAGDGVEAISRLTQKRYDLVLVDLVMPKMDGLELLKNIHKQWGAATPVIIMTGHASVELASTVIKEGARDFIIKPFEMKTLLDAVDYAIRRGTPSALADIDPGGRQNFQAVTLQPAEGPRSMDLSLLDKIGESLNGLTEMDKIGTTLISMLQQILQTQRALFVVYHSDRHEVKHHYLWSCENPESKELTSSDLCVLEWISRKRRPLYIEDIATEDEFLSCLGEDLTEGSLLAVPCKRNSRILGALVLWNQKSKNGFAQNALAFVTALASMTSLAIQNAELFNELKSYFTDTIRALIAALESKDAYAFGHSGRVARYALMLVKKLELSEIEERRLEYLALLHDVGKIGIPEEILKKGGSLNEEERQIFRTHAELGEKIVHSLQFLPEGGKIIRGHHEQYNGRGYPDGLQGEAIPLFSRIIAIADAFDGLVSSAAPLSVAVSMRPALEELRRRAGEQFDPTLVDLFIQACRQYFTSTG